MVTIDFRQVSFSQPQVLWLLIVPIALIGWWAWRLAERRADAERLARTRIVPLRERFAIAGDLPFWLFLSLATALLVFALARPRGPARAVRQGGVDVVLLQDASASMRARDV